jgi:integrase
MFVTLLGCGLRRSELTKLTMKHVQQRDNPLVHSGSGREARARADDPDAGVDEERNRRVDGSSCRDGGTPVPARRPGRSSSRGTDEQKGRVANAKGVRRRAGLPDIAPHDLRRTTAKLCRAAGGELEQIQLLLGHPR